MATLNEMIAQGAQFNVPDPTAQYNKLAQMQKYQQENELAKMQMEEYGRARQESNALRQFLPGLNDSNRSQLLGYGAAGQGVFKALGEVDTQRRLAEQARSQADLNESSILKNAVAQTRDAVAGIDPNDVESYAALRTSVLTQYPKLAPYMPAAWDASVKQRLIVTAASVLEGQKPRPPVILKPGEMAIPANDPRLMGTGVTAPAAAAAAAVVPPSVAEYQFAKTADGGNFVGSYQDFVKAKADAARGPAAVAAPPALPASVQEYEYAKTVPGGGFIGTYQNFVKAKADAARGPAPVVAPPALPASVQEYQYAKTLDGGGFVGTYQDFVQAKAEANRAPIPIAAPPASVAEYEYAKTPAGGGFVGSYEGFLKAKADAARGPATVTAPPTKVAEYEYAKTPAGGSYKGTYQQFLNLGKSEGGGAAVPKAPSGYRVTKSGDLEPIPGGPAAGKPMTDLQKQGLKKDFAADTSKIKSSIDTADELEKLTDELVGNPDKKIKPHPGLSGITGYQGLLPSFAESPVTSGNAAKAEQKLDTFKGKIKTLGRSLASLDGKLGNMAVQEWKFISDAVQEIRPTAGNLDEQMRDVVRQARLLAKNLRDKFDLTYDETTAAPGKPAAAALAPADKQALDWANANPKDPRSLQIKQRLGQ
jgi:hypothetical protein